MSSHIESPKHREIQDGFHWTQECLLLGELEPLDRFDTSAWLDEADDAHSSQNAFLLTDEESLLLDTLTLPNSDAVLSHLDTILEGDRLDYLVISHPEANHAGNAFTIMQEYPEATVIVPGRGAGRGQGHTGEHELYHLITDDSAPGSVQNDIEYVTGGETIDLGAFEVEFHRPHIADHAFTTWMTERTTETLFPIDGLGFLHPDSKCIAFADEFDHEVTVEQLYRFHSRAFPWMQFVDPAKMRAAADEMWDQYSPAMVAPAHGSVVRRDTRSLFEKFATAAEYLSEQGRPELIRQRVQATMADPGATVE